MLFAPLTALLASTILLAPSNALGINCRGSSVCGSAKTKNAVKKLAQIMLGEIDTCRSYKNGEHIACLTDGNVLSPNGGFCAFLQHTGDGASGLAIQALISMLADRTDDVCGNCGSIPYSYPPEHGGKNDPAAGILTVNFVRNTDNPCPTGMC